MQVLRQEAKRDRQDQLEESRRANDDDPLNVGLEEWPIAPAVFEEVVREHARMDAGAPIGGFSKYAPSLRSEWAKRLLVRDNGEIPTGRKYSKRLPCAVAMPGMCVGRDSQLFSVLQGASEQLTELLLKHSVGTFFLFRRNQPERNLDMFGVLGARRFARPKLAVLVQCSKEEMDDGEVRLELEQVSDGSMHFITPSVLMRAMFDDDLEARESSRVKELSCCKLAIHNLPDRLGQAHMILGFLSTTLINT